MDYTLVKQSFSHYGYNSHLTAEFVMKNYVTHDAVRTISPIRDLQRQISAKQLAKLHKLKKRIVLDFTIIFNSIFNRSAWDCSFFSLTKAIKYTILCLFFCPIFNKVLLQLKVFNVVISSRSWLVWFMACNALTKPFFKSLWGNKLIEKTLPKPTLLKKWTGTNALYSLQSCQSLQTPYIQHCILLNISFAYNNVLLSTVALRRCLLKSNTVLNVSNSAEYEV